MGAPVPPLDEAKRRLRRTLRKARAGLSDDARLRAEASIASHLEAACADLRVVGLYACAGSEVSLDGLAERLTRRGVALAWPRVEGDHLRFYCAALGELVPGFRGLREPSPEATYCPLESLDVLCVPGLGFDLYGNRLGQGGGFYDRLLSHTEVPKRVGVGFGLQLVSEIPVTPTDVSIDQLVTEEGFARGDQWPSFDAAPSK